MSGRSDRFFGVRQIPRMLLHILGWVLLCRSLQDVVPPAWAWSALPSAAVTGYLVYRLRLRMVPAIASIALLPWLIRLAVFAVSSAIISDLPVTFDNGWFMTAPYLYFSALSIYLVARRPGAGIVETIILAGFTILLLDRDNLWSQSLSGPAADSLNLIIAVLVILLTILSFAAVRRDVDLRISGIPGSNRGLRISAGRICYGMTLAAALALLLLAGNRIRRDQSIQSGGGLLASDMFRFDFSDVLSLEPEISLNAELTMLYREDGPATVRHLRRYTLSGWDDERGFFRDGDMESDHNANPIPVTLPKGPRDWPEGDIQARIDVSQEYYLIALDPESFFALNYPVSVEPWIIWDDASFTRAYAVESRVSVAGPWELMDAGYNVLPRKQLEYYLEGGDDSYFVELADNITGNLNNRWSKVSAVERWFHENYYYSLNPGLAPDGDQLSWFLKETRRGYCSYFSFAMTRICRAAGIPARVAVGFLTDPDTSTLGFVPVRSDQAHAWVEVWFDEYGWITFDPTSEVMAPGEEYPFQFISPDEWLSLIEEVLTRSGEVSVAMEDESKESGDDGPWWKLVTGLVRRRPGLPWIAVAILLFITYLPGRIVPGAVRLTYIISRRPRRRTLGSWSLFAGRLSRAGYGPNGEETPLDWALRIENAGIVGLMEWTHLYLKAEYSPRYDKGDEKAAGIAASETVKNWRQIPLSRRLRALVGPGWCGGFPW